MRTNKLLLFSTIILLLVNLVLAYFLWNNKRDHRSKDRKQDRGDWMVKELGLSEAQQAEHKKLKEAHFNSLKPIFDSMTQTRRELYAMIRNGSDSSTNISAYTDKIGRYQGEVTARTFEHFKQVRAMLDTEQQVKLDSLVQRIVNDMGKRKGGPREKDRKPQE